MASLEERIRELEEEIRKTPYNKATAHHIGRLKARIARLREEAEKRSVKRGGGGYGVRKGGDATVVLVGYPSVGKSTLLNKLTGAKSEVGSYDFTTLRVVPGIMNHKKARIQILDIPGIIEGASMGRGRGREVLSVVRSADLIVLLVDASNPSQLDIIKRELHSAGIRLNKKRPEIFIRKKKTGGINISSTSKLDFDEDIIKSVLQEYKVHNADVLIRGKVGIDDVVDALSERVIYKKAITVFNKIDLCTREELKKLDEGAIFISAESGYGIDTLKERIYQELDLIRVFMRPQGGEPDFEEPLVLRKGSTIEDVCIRLHKDFVRKFRYAQVWGSSVKFDGQRVGLEHELSDRDVVTIVIEK
jgi:hypothetical protein